MDPITTAIVAALAAGVAQGFADTGKQLIVDAYTALRDAIKAKCGATSEVAKAVEGLEQKPESEGRTTTLAEEVAEANLADDAKLVGLAETLAKALAQSEEGREALAKYQINAPGAMIGGIGDNWHVEGGIKQSTTKQ